MQTFKRKCFKPYKFKEFELIPNKEYLTSKIENNKVVVFSIYWKQVPIEYFFKQAIEFTPK